MSGAILPLLMEHINGQRKASLQATFTPYMPELGLHECK